MLALLVAVLLPNDRRKRRNNLKTKVLDIFVSGSHLVCLSCLVCLHFRTFPASAAFLLFSFCKRHAGMVLQNKICGMQRKCFPRGAGTSGFKD